MCPASPEARASLSAHTTAFTDTPARVAWAVPTHCQESCCGLFLPIPTALLEELEIVYHIPSVQGDPGHVSDHGHVSHPGHVSFVDQAALGWPLGATRPPLSTGNLQPQCAFLLLFLELRETGMSIYHHFQSERWPICLLLLFLELSETSMSIYYHFWSEGWPICLLLLFLKWTPICLFIIIIFEAKGDWCVFYYYFWS